MKVIQTLAKETSVVQAFNVLKSPMVCTSLNIPTEIWLLLEPQLKQRITEIKNEIRKKRAQTTPPPRSPMPPQYPSPAQRVNAMMAQFGLNSDEGMSSGEETDDEALHTNAFHTTLEDDLEVRANLGHVDKYSGSDKYFAISDGGADSCVVGKNAVVVSHTGRYATLVGYDPKHTRSKRIPILTAYLKVKAHNGIPILLKINEAVYNEGSPVTLLSEYQIREFGFVIDSVAQKHLKAPGQQGLQRFILNDVVHIPFDDRGGIMGFEILPIADGEIDEIDPIFDVFEVTGPKKWIPARFRHTHACQHAPRIPLDPPEPLPMDSTAVLLQDTTYESLVSVPDLIEAEDPSLYDRGDLLPGHQDLSFKAMLSRKTYNGRIKPWHRVAYDSIKPESLRKFLGWRPAEVVKLTLEHTTQLAKTSITYPLQRHFKARNPFSNVYRLNEVVSTNPICANCPSIDNKFIGAQFSIS